MTGKGKLPPPRGAEQTRAALLSGRFSEQEPVAPAAAPAAAPSVAASSSASKAAGTPRPPKASSSRTPTGMVRRSYYLSKDAADQFDSAIARLVESTGGLLPRHEAAAALIAAGTGQAEAVLAEVRQRLMANVQGK
jgi:hypothetical protein